METPRFKVHEFVWVWGLQLGGVVLSISQGTAFMDKDGFPRYFWNYEVRLTSGKIRTFQTDHLMPWSGVDRSKLWEAKDEEQAD